MGKKLRHIGYVIIALVSAVILTVWVFSLTEIIRDWVGSNKILFVGSSIAIIILGAFGIVSLRKLIKKLSGS